ncbi:hypothetical protein CPB85DRAFT_1320190 [Mucidula mucida]|nr:hypothetical protein CPB85DRAFT_1320190 [Mucidula mucida]
MSTSKAYCVSTPASYASLTLGVLPSTSGVTVSVAAMLTFKLCPSLSPRAPEFPRISTPICSPRRSRRSSIDTVASDDSSITIDSVSTLVEPDIKRKRRLSAASIRKPFVKLAKTTKKEIRPTARRMSDSFTAVSAPFTTSTTSLFSPASNLYLPRTTSTQAKAAVKKARPILHIWFFLAARQQSQGRQGTSLCLPRLSRNYVRLFPKSAVHWKRKRVHHLLKSRR